jgi:1-acyl-sn-glycerol-3-phosphate acyltransferase
VAVIHALKAAWVYSVVAFGIALLAVMCFIWGVVCALLLLVMPARPGRHAGRLGAMVGFRVFLAIVQAFGVLRLDLDDLDSLRDEGALIVAPNHPSLLDAVLVVSRLPNALCVMKASLLGNFLLGPAARLARYVRNDTLRGLAARAGEELRLGGHLVLFPEGTRSIRDPVGPFTAAAGVIARHTGVPIQTVFIEADSRFLGKGWPGLSRPALPLRYRVQLGRRFEAPSDVRAFTAELESYFVAELAARRAPAGRIVVSGTAQDAPP